MEWIETVGTFVYYRSLVALDAGLHAVGGHAPTADGAWTLLAFAYAYFFVGAIAYGLACRAIVLTLGGEGGLEPIHLSHRECVWVSLLFWPTLVACAAIFVVAVAAFRTLMAFYRLAESLRLSHLVDLAALAGSLSVFGRRDR